MKFPALFTLPLLALAAYAQTSTPTPADTAARADTTALRAPASAGPEACAHPFGLSDNMELVYRLADADGKAQGELHYRVVRLGSELNKKKTRTTTTVLLKSGRYDAKSHLTNEQDLTFRCSRDTTFTDGRTQFDPASLKSFRERLFDFTPVSLAWPNQPKVGSALPPGGIQIQVRSSAVDIAKVSTMVLKRRVVSGPEAVKTPAGTFQCYKVEGQRESTTKARADVAFRSAVRVVDYYSPAVGIVKTEVYDKKGKLAQTATLAALTRGK